MKLTINSSVNNTEWPDEDFWLDLDPYDIEFDDAWGIYLCNLEDSVNDALGVSPEPSTQGYLGDMFIADNSGEHEPIEVDFGDWVENQQFMAAKSKSADQYKKRYMRYLKGVIEYYWG